MSGFDAFLQTASDGYIDSLKIAFLRVRYLIEHKGTRNTLKDQIDII